MNKIQKDIINSLKRIVEKYPDKSVAFHLGMALSDYPIIENISDTELLKIFKKHKQLMELNDSIPHEEDIEDIIKDGLFLDVEEDEEY